MYKKYFSEDSSGSTRKENELVFGERPNSFMIYTAGKMSSDAVRDSIALWRLNLQERLALYNVDLGFYHPEFTGCDHTGIWPEETVSMDTTMLKKSDLVVAYLDQDELYGTLTEIMMAHYLNKKLAIFIDKTMISDLDRETNIYSTIFKTKHTCPCMLMTGPDFLLNKYWFPLEFISQNHNDFHVEITSSDEVIDKMADIILEEYQKREQQK